MISASFVVDSKLLDKRSQGNRLDAKYIFNVMHYLLEYYNTFPFLICKTLCFF